MLNGLAGLAIDPVGVLYWAVACNAFATGVAAGAEGHGGLVSRCYFIGGVAYALIGLFTIGQLH